MINAILACTGSLGIGYQNDLPWPRNSKDMTFFKQMTTNSTIIMGRNTWVSLGRKLPNRTNVVVSSKRFDGPDLLFVDPESPESIIQSLSQESPIWIIGGAKIYEYFKPVIQRILVTNIQGDYPCDTFLPTDFFDGFKPNKYPTDTLDITEWIR